MKTDVYFARDESFGVIAYENANSVEHLKAVLQHSDSFHGFCYDFGHKHCYEPDVDMLAWFGDRLLYTHIHDNIKALKKRYAFTSV